MLQIAVRRSTGRGDPKVETAIPVRETASRPVCMRTEREGLTSKRREIHLGGLYLEKSWGDGEWAEKSILGGNHINARGAYMYTVRYRGRN